MIMQPDVIKKLAGAEPTPVVITATEENELDGVADSNESLSETASALSKSEPNSAWEDALLYAKYSYQAVIDAMSKEVRVVDENLADAWKEELDDLKLQAAREQLERPDLTAEELSTISDFRAIPTPGMIELEGKISAADLTKGKGMSGMLNTIWLILCAMTFGGVMEACGLLQRIAHSLMSVARSTWSLVATTAGSCLFVNFTASDQYLAIVLPGRMFSKAFKDRGLAPQNLSRTLEDSGTVTSVLIPWNTCGAVQQATLGVGAMAYAPFCFFNWISPLMTITFAILNIRIARLPEDEGKDQ
jgi:NhaC family Na+:H+ antiporter